MKLTLEGITSEKEKYEASGIRLPAFDIEEMKNYTKENPCWIHFGAGNIYRGYIAKLQQALLDNGIEKYGIVAVDCFDTEIIDRIYKPHDNLTLFAGLKKDGNIDKQIIASTAYALRGSRDYTDDYKQLVKMFESDALCFVSFTITEKGYAVLDMNGNILDTVKADIENGPNNCRHMMSIITSVIYRRYVSGKKPVALVSMDNCSHNGDRLKDAVLYIAQKWAEKKYVEEAFLSYLKDESKVTFPLTMIDKITPRPDANVKKILTDLGIEDLDPVTTDKNTYIAPFVNAEIPEYLVIEDKFPCGRPKLEHAGVIFADRETVDKTEKMKVTTCLNPLHTALAVFGCLLSYNKISDEMQDEDLKALVEKLGYNEGLPVVVNPGIISPEEFLDEVLSERLPNPFMPDTPQRIATDTSQKIPIRYGITIKAYEQSGRVDELTMIPLVIAAWLRYLLGKDDALNDMEISPDPMSDMLKEKLNNIKIGDTESVDMTGVREILENEIIFSTNLIKNGLYKKIEPLFLRMISGKGTVRETLDSMVQNNYLSQYNK